MPEEEDRLPTDKDKFKDAFASDEAETMWKVFRRTATVERRALQALERMLWELFPEKMQEREMRMTLKKLASHLSEEKE